MILSCPAGERVTPGRTANNAGFFAAEGIPSESGVDLFMTKTAAAPTYTLLP